MVLRNRRTDVAKSPKAEWPFVRREKLSLIKFKRFTVYDSAALQ